MFVACKIRKSTAISYVSSDGWYNPPPGEQELESTDRLQKKYQLFDLDKDPCEKNDVSDIKSHEVLMRTMIAKLKKYKRQAMASLQPDKVDESEPANWNGAWTPGWC